MSNKTIAIFLLFSFFTTKPNELMVNAPGVSVKVPTSSGEQPIKIRVVEGRKFVSDTAEGKDIEAELKNSRNSYDSEIKALDQKLQTKYNELETKARTRAVDNDVLEKEQADLMESKKQRDVKAEALQAKFTRQFETRLGKFNNQMIETIAEEAKKDNLDLVIIKESGQIAYASNRIDGTDRMIQAHDRKYKAKKAEALKKQTQAMPSTGK